ncbi:MAG: hypothetical protein IJN67_09985 [Oscillospiraceae bacterium]|nr:hypothetical protein [Oscillospiraceae bacterium]
MNLETTLSTMEPYISETLSQVLDKAVSYIPEEVADVIWHASSYLPKQIDWISAAKFMLYFAAASLILGLLSRMVLGKSSSLNHSLSSAMGILFIYSVTIVIYTFKPWNLEMFLSPLPFVNFSEEYLILLPISDIQFPALCAEVLSLVILAFLVNLLDTFIPRGERFGTWLILRLLMVLFSMMLHLLVCWGFRTYLPEVLVTYAPVILLLLLVFMMLSGLLNLILGLVIAVTSPFLGAMYTFFFSNIVGKQLSKAVFTSAILCAIAYLMDLFGYTVICITAASLLTYIPIALVLLALWYLIGHVL